MTANAWARNVQKLNRAANHCRTFAVEGVVLPGLRAHEVEAGDASMCFICQRGAARSGGARQPLAANAALPFKSNSASIGR